LIVSSLCHVTSSIIEFYFICSQAPTGISKTALLSVELCVLTGALKYFIRQLEMPIMTFQLHDSFMSAM
ncbi:unnamed protein product, partial [Schistosoma turkestanicum]